jgi:CBS domain-containing protein
MARKVTDVMTRNVDVARPEEPVREIALRMAKGNFGFMPVVDGKRLIGTITDRDLTIRVLAAAKDPSTPVGEVLTREVSFVRADEDLDDVLGKMGGEQIRRLPVVDDMGELIGVVSLGDLTAETRTKAAGEALKDISQPAGSKSFS